jgi:8-oxo-dGTP pyrophosphatase MutT (NUDIX family)
MTFTKSGTTPEAAPRDAATVLLLRARDGLEIFMVRRHGASAFMGGAHVFPGGKVDADEDLARIRTRDPQVLIDKLGKTPGKERPPERTLAIYAAAIREVAEETKVEIASGDDLIPWAHWITPSHEPKRFDTHFFLAEMPPDQAPAIDEKETTEGAWLSPKEAIARHDRGELFLPPPTLINLLELAPMSSPAEAFAAARARAIAPILPKIGAIGESLAILLPWDPLYDAAEGASLPPHPGGHPLAGPISRIVLDGQRWIATGP